MFFKGSEKREAVACNFCVELSKMSLCEVGYVKRKIQKIQLKIKGYSFKKSSIKDVL